MQYHLITLLLQILWPAPWQGTIEIFRQCWVSLISYFLAVTRNCKYPASWFEFWHFVYVHCAWLVLFKGSPSFFLTFTHACKLLHVKNWRRGRVWYGTVPTMAVVWQEFNYWAGFWFTVHTKTGPLWHTPCAPEVSPTIWILWRGKSSRLHINNGSSM